MPPQTPHPLGYIHSFSKTEQQRLVRQACFEPYVFPSIDYSAASRSSGRVRVGHQIAVLLRRWPTLIVTGVDRAESRSITREF